MIAELLLKLLPEKTREELLFRIANRDGFRVFKPAKEVDFVITPNKAMLVYINREPCSLEQHQSLVITMPESENVPALWIGHASRDDYITH